MKTKVYLVREDYGEYSDKETYIAGVFSTLEKAQNYVKQMNKIREKNYAEEMTSDSFSYQTDSEEMVGELKKGINNYVLKGGNVGRVTIKELILDSEEIKREYK